MDGRTRAADLVGPLRAQVALCYGVVCNVPDSLECWQDDLAFGLARALELVDRLKEELEGKPDDAEQARTAPGDVP